MNRSPTRKPLLQYLWPIFSLGVAGLLFYSSHMQGEASGGASMGIVEQFQQLLPFLQRFDADTLHFLLRKAAHFAAYFSLGLCMAHTLKYYVSGTRWWLSAWGVTSLYGILDELHQHFIPGRRMMAADMVLNAVGAAAGILIVWLYLKRRPPHIVEGSDSSASGET